MSISTYFSMTFCSAYGRTCVNEKCRHALTDERHYHISKWLQWARLSGVSLPTADMSSGCEDMISTEVMAA